MKKNLTVIASASFLFGVNSSLSAEVLPDLVKAYSLDELVESVETEVSNLKDAFNLTVSETVKGVNKTESSLQAQENVRYLNEHQRKANERERIANENARIASELERKDTFDTLVDSEVIEQTVVQEVAEKYQEIEALNAPEMVSFRQQLADIDSVKIGGNVLAGMDNLGQDIKTAITGGSVAVIGGESVGYNNFSRGFKEGFGALVQNFDAWSQGYYNHTSGAFYPASSDQKYLTLNCVEGDRFKFTLRPNTTSVAALIVKNAGGAIIAYLNSATEYTDYEYVVPANATTITFQRTFGTNQYPYSLFKFTFTNMARQDDMIDATSKITQIRSSIYGFDYEEVGAVYTTGYRGANGTLWPAADEYLNTEIACVPGEKFKISAVIAVTTVPLILAYNDAVKLSTVTGLTSYTEYEYTVPDYTTKIIVNVKSRSGATNYAYSIKKQVDVDYVQKLVPLIKNVPQNHIICPGDSLTAGANTTADAYKYPQYLQTLITDGSEVHNFGVGGEASPSIAMRQGGLPLFVKPFTIPATVTATEINLYNDVNVAVTLALQGSAGLNPVTINGVQGAISYTSSKFYFTRSAPGSETVVSRPSRVITSGMGYKGGTLVIWSGTNDSYGVTDAIALSDKLIKSAKTMIDYNGTDNYIIIGLISKNYCAVVAEVNILLAKEFGNHFLDIRKYLLDYGLADAEITPTTQDTTDIASGEIPLSLRSDSVHLNDYGYPIVAQQTYKKGVELDYWK